MEIKEALDAVVEDILSMSKEELNKQLAESAKTDFAKTLDYMMNTGDE